MSVSPGRAKTRSAPLGGQERSDVGADMNGAVTIREATEADLPLIGALYEGSGADALGVNDMQSLQAGWQRLKRDTPTAKVLIAERDGRPVGTLTCFVLPNLAHGGRPGALVESVAVMRDVQGQGIGRALMDAAMAIAREQRAYKLALSSNLKRTPAHAFYEKLGYARHGVSFVAYPEDAE